MKIQQKLNLELHHLWYSLEDLQCHSYPDDIDKKIKELQFYIEKKIFEEIPSDFDVIDEDCILIRTIKI